MKIQQVEEPEPQVRRNHDAETCFGHYSLPKLVQGTHNLNAWSDEVTKSYNAEAMHENEKEGAANNATAVYNNTQMEIAQEAYAALEKLQGAVAAAVPYNITRKGPEAALESATIEYILPGPT